MLARIVRWALERPRLIALACLGFLIWGAVFIHDIRFDLFPAAAPAETTIQTEAPGLVAEQVEALVTRPIESGLIGAAGVAQVQSRSVQGLSVISVRFAEGADPVRARQFVSESLTSLAGSLPPQAAPPRMAPLTAEGGAVLKVGFTSDRLDPLALRDLVQWTVRPRLLASAGVARVSVYGGKVRRIEVRARPADLSDSDLGFLDILNAVKRVTSVAGAGFIDTPSQRVLIEPHGQALTIDDVSAGQIATPSAAPVRIGDVSDVVETAAPSFGDALIDGKPGVIVTVERQYGANTLQTTHAVESQLAELQPLLVAQGVKADTTLDRPATFTTSAVRGIAFDLTVGAVLIALMLALVLRDVRAVLVSVISIPLSLMAALIALKALGWTLDTMTLGGLIVSLGIVIDDAVIGVESVIAHLREAEHDHASDLEAILTASLEARRPVTYSVAAVIVALAPLLVLKGLQGALLAPLAVAVIVSVLASLAVATVVTPALCLLFHRHDRAPPEPAFVVCSKRGYELALGRICGRPAMVLIGGVAAIGLAAIALGADRPTLLPSVHDGDLVVQASAPPSTSLEVMRGYGADISADVVRIPGVRLVSQTIGRDVTAPDSWGPEHSVFDIALSPDLGAAAQDRIARQVGEAFAHHPGLTPIIASRFDTLQKDVRTTAPVQIRLFGQDLDALDDAADQLLPRLGALKGAGEVQAQSNARGPVMRVDLNFPRMALYGLSAADVLDTVRAAFAGETVAQIYQNDRAIDLAVSAQDKLRQDPEGVGDLLLRSNSGVSVPLKSVANVYLTDGRVMITHDGGLRRQVITASPRDPEAFIRGARKIVGAKGALPPGSFADFGGAYRSAQQATQALALNYLLAVLVVAALLAVIFNAQTAVVILISTLFSFAGGVAAVALLGGVLSVGAIAGFVALFGISLRSGVLLFDWLDEDGRGQGRALTLDSIVVASRKRLTPVLLTAVLVILGLAPLALHAGFAGREILGPMSLVIIGGLVTGALANLFVLPAMIFLGRRKAAAPPHEHDHHAHAHDHTH